MPASGINSNRELYSHEVRDIISNRPAWIVRNGITFFFFILCGIFALSFFIRYPDVVTAKAKLVSLNPPIELRTKVPGKLVHLYVKEKDSVVKGAIIASIESVADADKIVALYHTLLLVKALSDSSQISPALQLFYETHETQKWGAGLGEVQTNYQTFMTSFYLFKQYIEKGFYLQKREMLQKDINFLQKMTINFLEQQQLLEEDIELASKNFSANESLSKDKVIADVEFRNEKSKFIGKRMSLPQLKASIIGNASSIHEKRKEILQLENEIAQQKNIFIEALNSFVASLEQWQSNYLIKSPIKGSVVFSAFINENQFYAANQTICLINPNGSSYYAQVLIPQNNFGKIKTTQDVLLKLPAYPYQEFGLLKGKLDFISQIPTDSGFLAKIILPKGLYSNQHKTLQYREGLIAAAEIITSDRKLIERFFSSLRGLINQN